MGAKYFEAFYVSKGGAIRLGLSLCKTVAERAGVF